MKTTADKIIEFNKNLDFDKPLPPGIRVMNPFRENLGALNASSAFYSKYYSDDNPRYILLGINPGRFGAGLTGVPFTDPKRLRERCVIRNYNGPDAHEPSSVFVYEVIKEYGGEDAFYSNFYINSVCPLGFTAETEQGKEVNYNYYDSPELAEAVRPFIIESIWKQLDFNIIRDVCFCLGTGKNEKFLRKLNDEQGFFERIIALEHPRYIIQYKLKHIQEYIDKYVQHFRAL